MSNENLDRRFDNLLREYREACPEVEPSADFMPGLWQKIEARQSVPFAMRRFTRVFVSAAAALSLLMGTLLLTPSVRNPNAVIGLIDLVEDEVATVAYADIDVEPHGESSWQ